MGKPAKNVFDTVEEAIADIAKMPAMVSGIVGLCEDSYQVR